MAGGRQARTGGLRLGPVPWCSLVLPGARPRRSPSARRRRRVAGGDADPHTGWPAQVIGGRAVGDGTAGLAGGWHGVLPVIGVDRCAQRWPAPARLSVTQLTDQTLACQQSRPHRGIAVAADVRGKQPYPGRHVPSRAVTSPQGQGIARSAADAGERLAEAAQPRGTDFALGIEARCRALLSDGVSADDLYREAVDRLSRTRLRPELARAHLLYGEWLRREGRRVDAREQLRTAHGMLAAIVMEAFAGRARRELVATGEKVRKRSVEPRAGGGHHRPR